MKIIQIEDNIHSACPEFKGAAVYAEFANSPYSARLWEEIEQSVKHCRQQHTTESLKQIPSILATRNVYRRLGKDPSRYRPSGEALLRRVLQGKDLYQINTAVDLVNLASMEYGYSIGGFDCDKIQGDTLRLGVGRKDEPYEGIGRGMLNIEGLPVYRDEIGGIGTPTSDNERTAMSLETSHLLALVNGYDGDSLGVMACAQRIAELLAKYTKCYSCDIVSYGYEPQS